MPSTHRPLSRRFAPQWSFAIAVSLWVFALACDNDARSDGHADASASGDVAPGVTDSGDTASDAEPDRPADAPDAPDDSATASDAASDAAPLGAITQGCTQQCEQLAECSSTPPTDDEFRECVDRCVTDLVAAPPACVPVYVEFIACWRELVCDVLREGPPTEPGDPCAAEYAAYGEECLLAGLPTCRALVGRNGDCSNSDECADGGVCLDGRCADPPVRGQPCADGTLCGPELACSFSTGVCEPIPVEGEPCALGTRGPHVCADGLGCRQNETFEGVCGLLPEEGETCTFDNRCAPPLGCDFSPEGSLCRPRRPAGGRCEADHICAAGTYCEFSDGECRAFLELGAPCGDGNECGPNRACLPESPSEFACAPLPSIGERCLFECVEGAFCGD